MLEDIRRGYTPPPLPERTIDQVPWQRGRRAKSELLEGEVEFEWDSDCEEVAGSRKIEKEDTRKQIGKKMNREDTVSRGGLMSPAKMRELQAGTSSTTIGQLTTDAAGLGDDLSSSVSSEEMVVSSTTSPKDQAHYELIIWRTFRYKQDLQGNDITLKTRKCSFPITKTLAQKIFACRNVTLSDGHGLSLTVPEDDLSVLLPLLQATDGTQFPPEYVQTAEQQFAEIVNELVDYQRNGYGRWSLEALRRRIVIVDAPANAMLPSHLEAIVVIHLTGIPKGEWLGLPGYDSEGNLQIVRADQTTPLFEVSNSENRIITAGNQQPAPPTSPYKRTNFIRNETTFPQTPFKAQVPAQVIIPPHLVQRIAAISTHSSPAKGDHDNTDAHDEDMSMIHLEDTHVTIKQTPPPRSQLPVPTPPRGHLPRQLSVRNEIRLSTSTTPYLPHTPARKVQYSPMFGSGVNVWKNPASNETGERSSVRAVHANMMPDTPRPKSKATDTWPGGTIFGMDTDRASLRRDVLTNPPPFQANKTYVSSRNPSNPLPGSLLSPGVIQSDPTVRIVTPTPPAPKSKAHALVSASNISHAGKPSTGMFAKPGAPASAKPGILRSTSGTSEPGTSTSTFTSTLKPPHGHGIKDEPRVASPRLPPTKSLQNLADRVGEGGGGLRRRWEQGTAASLAKERPPSPLKRSGTESPSKEQDNFTHNQREPRAKSRAASPVGSLSLRARSKSKSKSRPASPAPLLHREVQARAKSRAGSQSQSLRRAASLIRKPAPTNTMAMAAPHPHPPAPKMFAAAQPTAASVARSGSVSGRSASRAAALGRPKSRAAVVAGEGGAGGGRYGGANVRSVASLRHEGVDGGGVKVDKKEGALDGEGSLKRGAKY